MAFDIETKICSACKRVLPLSAFSPAVNYKDGYRGQCRQCRASYSAAYKIRTNYKDPHRGRRHPKSPRNKAKARDTRLRDYYGITAAQFEEMLAKQGGCAICASSEPRGGRHNLFVVDHCHSTGRVRGILCHPCNVGLGALGDNVAALRRAVSYLERIP